MKIIILEKKFNLKTVKLWSDDDLSAKLLTTYFITSRKVCEAYRLGFRRKGVWRKVFRRKQFLPKGFRQKWFRNKVIRPKAVSAKRGRRNGVRQSDRTRKKVVETFIFFACASKIYEIGRHDDFNETHSTSASLTVFQLLNEVDHKI